MTKYTIDGFVVRGDGADLRIARPGKSWCVVLPKRHGGVKLRKTTFRGLVHNVLVMLLAGPVTIEPAKTTVVRA